ncbi:class I SAM-dependent methyltransferase [Lentibacillus sediminis]|uniref:class I SAM-dependent methyltransferase n=1 Tax=Lentibacillus sediminis TaxID=1940529 RepID=UPI000C1C371A|nr:class I SAM-dependent methyltransferase [Lentibacillus sediminis]
MREKEVVKQKFAKNKAAYVTSTTHAKGADLPLLTQWLNPQQDMKILDIATGGGHVAKQLAPFVKQVIASDLTKEMLAHTSQHLLAYSNIEYVLGDAEDLPFLDETFDVVTCRIAAHHFPNPSLFLQEANRVLKAGGSFLLIDNVAAENTELNYFINTLEEKRDSSHVCSLTIRKWRELLQESNFTIAKSEERKKRLPYEEWLNRTVDTEEEKQEITAFITNADQHIRDYFQIEMTDGSIAGFTIDEWMVLCKKE